MVSESPDVRLSAITPHYQVGIVWLFNSKRWLLSTRSTFWQQRSQHRLISPSTAPYFHNSLENCVLVYLLSSRKRYVHPMCVMTTALMNCAVCNGLSVRTRNSKVWIYTLCESCSVMLRVYSPCAWFVEGRPNPISRRVLMTRNRTLSPHDLGREPFLRCARASTQRWRRRRSKRRDSRFVFEVRASRWWEVVLREVVLRARLFERNCARETVLQETVLLAPVEKFFWQKLFYEKWFC